MKKFFWSLFEILKTVAMAAVAVVLVRNFVVQPFLVSGGSMQPNFYGNDYLLIDELTYRFREPERGEVVVFKYPGDRRSFYIKRIIGLPGEKVLIDDGEVKIFGDGRELILKENYLSGNQKTSGHHEIVLDGGQYFVMGDNRPFSFDSRNWGPLEKSEIIGLVRLRLWPISEVMAFSSPVY